MKLKKRQLKNNAIKKRVILKRTPKFKKLNILVVTHKTESFVRDIAIHTSKFGNNIILYGPKPEGMDLKSILKSKIKFIPTRVRSIFTSGEKIEDEFLEKPRFEMFKHFFLSLIEVFRIVMSKKVDVIHAHWVLPSGFMCSLVSFLFRKPLIITAHGRSIYYDPKLGKTTPKKGYVRLMYIPTFLLMKKIVAVSKFLKEIILSIGVNPSKIKLIYNGTNLDQFNPKISGDKIKSKLKIENNFNILTVRKFFHRKGLQYLIKAISLLKEKISNVKLIMIGYGPLESSLKSLTKKLGLQDHVLFLGRIENQNLPPYYAASDVFVIPSLVEGFGVAAAEAMAMELPLISTNIKGLIEVSDSTNAMVVPPADEKAIAEAILKLWESPELRKKLGNAGRRKILEKFNWDRAGKEYNYLYESFFKK